MTKKTPKTIQRKDYTFTAFDAKEENRDQFMLIEKQWNIIGEVVHQDGRRKRSFRSMNRDYEILEEICEYLNTQKEIL